MSHETPAIPPRSGRGSGQAAWVAYARSIGLSVSDGLSRSEVMALIDGSPHGPHRASLERSLSALAVYDEHAALVESARSLAVAIDEADTFDDKLRREYRLALDALMEAGSGGVDELELEAERLRATVGHPPQS